MANDISLSDYDLSDPVLNQEGGGDGGLLAALVADSCMHKVNAFEQPLSKIPVCLCKLFRSPVVSPMESHCRHKCALNLLETKIRVLPLMAPTSVTVSAS
jgi:hypothetical protein